MTQLPEPSFILIVQLHHLQAMLHLGLIQNPQTGEANPRNDAKARHELGLLKILQEKTQGNLNDEEEKMINDVIASIEGNL